MATLLRANSQFETLRRFWTTKLQAPPDTATPGKAMITRLACLLVKITVTAIPIVGQDARTVVMNGVLRHRVTMDKPSSSQSAAR
ncbi:hypothetical protein CFD26_101307 [Aspergillus turcosus]|uniref:Uncharacterized protein n=1 Tax=Aspergillus turcosus TaxID=1245748 RepID=A0A3R7G8N8_9EURO|nr:hypothetical protein CFD26_101307 [Aspergillus turcosus]